MVNEPAQTLVEDVPRDPEAILELIEPAEANTRGVMPGATSQAFDDLAERARVGCALSKALAVEVTLAAASDAP